MSLISGKIDFVGVNYYTRSVSRYDDEWLPVCARGVAQLQSIHTETGWEVYPEALTRILVWTHEICGGLPLYITENGAAFYDAPAPIDGEVEDPLRVAYLRSHIAAAREAMRQGVPLKGYFAWSLLDNFEWSQGYSMRFGIIHVDYSTQERTVKSSGAFYSKVARSNGASLDE
jgi:beta-glucosidase